MACRGNNNEEEEQVFCRMKRECPNALAADEEEEDHHDSSIRRIIRSEFFKLKSLINEKKDDLMNTDSDKFDSILHEFDKLDEQVKKPQEQVADNEALLDLTCTLVGSVKSMVNEGVTPSQFVSSLLKHYAHPPNTSIDWQKLGIFVSPIFLTVHGSSTMLDPMESQLKRRKAIVL